MHAKQHPVYVDKHKLESAVFVAAIEDVALREVLVVNAFLVECQCEAGKRFEHRARVAHFVFPSANNVSFPVAAHVVAAAEQTDGALLDVGYGLWVPIPSLRASSRCHTTGAFAFPEEGVGNAVCQRRNSEFLHRKVDAADSGAVDAVASLKNLCAAHGYCLRD